MPQRIITSGNARIDQLNGDGVTAAVETLIAMLSEYMPQYAHYAGRIRDIVCRPYDADPNHYHHVWLAYANDTPAGLIVFEYLPQRNVGLGMDIAVVHAQRLGDYGVYRRLARLLIDSCIEQLAADAETLGRPPVIGLAAEVEYPALIKNYMRYGFVAAPFSGYYEPPDISGAHDGPGNAAELRAAGFNPMTLGVFPHPVGMTSYRPAVLWQHVVLAFLVDHYNLPADHAAVRLAVDSLDKHFSTAVR